jgi:hypothetical protein
MKALLIILSIYFGLRATRAIYCSWGEFKGWRNYPEIALFYILTITELAIVSVACGIVAATAK